MKQLLIVNDTTLNHGVSSPYDLSGLAEGAVTFFELGSDVLLSAAPTKNYAVALGRPNGQRPFIIPEIDLKTLRVVKALPKLGTAIKRKFTFPTPVPGTEYTVMFIKKGTVPHERNTWHCSVIANNNSTAASLADALDTTIEDKLGEFFDVTVSTADVTITGKNIGEKWEIKLIDGLYGTDFAGSTDFVDPEPSIGDKKYIQNLASQCAAGKGFEHTAPEGREFIPGYPEHVQDFQLDDDGPDGTSSKGYIVYTLRFAVGRDSAKTRDERVWQIVHIAIDVQSKSIEVLDQILSEWGATSGSDYYEHLMSEFLEDIVENDLTNIDSGTDMEELMDYLLDHGYVPGETSGSELSNLIGDWNKEHGGGGGKP